MIYTSYFSKLKSLPERIVPIAICGGIPEGYKGLWYRKLAPTWDIFSEWKSSNKDKEAIDRYVSRYKEEVLDKKDVHDVIHEIHKLLVENKYSIDSDIALVCYEKSGNFCHRHIVAEWITDKYHSPCVEYNSDKVIPECVYKYIKSIADWEDGHVISNDPYDISIAPYCLESHRSDCHYDMLDYYGINNQCKAKIMTSEYSMYKEDTFVGGMKYGSKYLKDKEIMARDFHSILMECKFRDENPEFIYGR